MVGKKGKTKLQKWRDSLITGIWVIMNDQKTTNNRLAEMQKDITEIKALMKGGDKDEQKS
jgi:hypothetical protein